MSTFKLRCPSCDATLRSSKKPRVGKEIECPQCAALFTIREDQIRTSTSQSVSGVMLDELLAGDGKSPPSPSAPVTSRPVMGVLEPVRKKPFPTPQPPVARILPPAPSAPASPSRLWMGIGALVVVLLLGAGAVAFYAFRNTETSPAEPRTPGDDSPLVIAGAKKDPPSTPTKGSTDVPSIPKDGEKKDEARTADVKKEAGPPKTSGDVIPPEIGKKETVELKIPKIEPEPPLKEKEPPAFSGPVTPDIPGVEPEKINRAVLRGAGYLKSQQLPTGTWSKADHGVGYAALGGLTLLECKFPPKDTSIQAAAKYVRMNSQKLDQTYDLSLAVLFLDRLGESRDKPLIQGLALRLVAGQNDRGGWDYRCPLLTPYDMNQLITYLQKTKQKVALQLPKKDETYQPPTQITFQQFDQTGKGGKQPADQLPGGPDQKGKGDQPGKRDQPGRGDQAPGKDQPASKGDLSGRKPGEDKDNSKKEDGASGAGTEVGKADPKKDATKDPVKLDPAKKDPAEAFAPKILPKGKGVLTPVTRPDFLPPAVRDLPIVSKGKGKGKAGRSGRDDNSNSQFALLALWAARRHGVPTERTLQLAGERYRSSQNADGGWGYQVGGGSTASMSCVGVLGLAMGIGTAPELPRTRAGMADGPGMAAKPILDDADVDRGFWRVAQTVGDPSRAGFTGSTGNLYHMWSVERVAMMYDLKTIGGKDWYGWGAQMLVRNQNADGSWNGANYPGHNNTIDTCLALLFLKRSNLADDLTRNFQHFLVIRDPGERER